MVELHGGKSGFESKLGVGSTFCFTLPVNPFAQAGKVKEAFYIHAASKGYETILVVEDDPKTSELLCLFLNKSGNVFAAVFSFLPKATVSYYYRPTGNKGIY